MPGICDDQNGSVLPCDCLPFYLLYYYLQYLSAIFICNIYLQYLSAVLSAVILLNVIVY